MRTRTGYDSYLVSSALLLINVLAIQQCRDRRPLYCNSPYRRIGRYSHPRKTPKSLLIAISASEPRWHRHVTESKHGEMTLICVYTVVIHHFHPI